MTKTQKYIPIERKSISGFLVNLLNLEWEDCVNDCEKAIKLDPKYYKSHIRKGKAL